MTDNPYRMLGVGLTISGTILGPIAFFILNSVPMTAIAISAIMIGITSIAIATTRPRISPEFSQLMFETGMENIVSFLEELGIKSKAIYLPSTMRTGSAQALIPLTENVDIEEIKRKIPERLIVQYGENPDDMAIAITAPGGVGLDKLEIKSGSTATEIEQVLNYVLTGLLDLANSAEVHISDRQLYIEISKPKLQYHDKWYYRCIGSPIASIVASIASDGIGKPIRIKEESYRNGNNIIHLEVLV